MSNESLQAEYRITVRVTLDKLGWSHGETIAYLVALETHGALRTGSSRWSILNAIASWTKTQPTQTPHEIDA